MARRKYEFRPDPTGFDWMSKLMLTKKQRRVALKWLLYSLLCVAGLVLQDSLLAQLRFLGGTVMEGCEDGSVFALLASMVYVFSGTGQDRYCILYLTLAAVLAAAFRQGYLRRGLGSDLICTGGAMLLYEMAVFVTGLFLGMTYSARWGVFVMTALVSTAVVGLVYKPLKIIGTIGGNLWKE